VSEKRAVVLLSGGLDSATVLAVAMKDGFSCHCLSFDYGQRHRMEIEYASKVAAHLGASEHRTLQVDIGAFGGSALTDMELEVPVTGADTDSFSEGVIPVTYVPARNTVFLAYALGWAEVLPAFDIFIGVNSVDYSGYPDCRPEFVEAFESMANLATKAGVEGNRITIHAPLIHSSKDEIIRKGVSLGVDYSITVSCYQLGTDGSSCGECDSCRIRRAGFESAGVPDPTMYR
jgi:7-cyano-7-deazaguanine synthase